jgi:mRNA interferase MazF
VDEGAQPVRVSRGELFRISGDPHPHVVVQEDVLNHSSLSTVVVCALTSNLRVAKEPGNVLLEPGEAGLPKQSVVVSSRIFTVEKSALLERLGALSDARVEEIFAGLRFVQTFFDRVS